MVKNFWLLPLCGALFLTGCNRDQNANPVPTPGVKITLTQTIFVPGKDDKLHARPASFKAIDTQTRLMGNAAPVLQEIIEKAPAFFPKGAKINDFKSDGKAVVVDLNKTFNDTKFWNSKGEKTTELAFYALVNTASGKENLPVSFTIEGAPASTLGEMDASGQIEPNPKLVAAK